MNVLTINSYYLSSIEVSTYIYPHIILYTWLVKLLGLLVAS